MSHLSEELINEYLDQMLDESTQQNVEIHLADCEQCTAQVYEFQTLFTALGELPELPLTRDLTQGILAQLPRRTQIPNLWQQPAFLIQSLLTLILLAVSMPILDDLAQQAMKWRKEIILPTLQIPTLGETIAKFTPLLVWELDSLFTLPEFTYTLPPLPTIPISSDGNLMFTLVFLVGILWIVGNFSLLRSKSNVKR